MIKIKIIEINKQVKNILIKGHAGYSVNGKDIVCAAVSSITITSINAILKIDSEAIKYTQKDYLSIEVLKNDEITNILIQNMLDLLTELEEKYNKNIKINREVS